MPSRGTIDEETRRRIVAWLRREMEDQAFGSIREFARRLEVSHSFLARVLAEEQAPGLDLVLRLTRRFGLGAERVLEEDPPRRYFLAAEPVAGEKPRRAGGRRPASRPIDADKWLARARASRRGFKVPVAEEEIARRKTEGRP